MDKISELLKEAKPLYKTRKRNRTIAKMLCCFAVPLVFFTSFMQLCILGDEVYLSMNNTDYQQEFLNDNFGLLRD